MNSQIMLSRTSFAFPTEGFNNFFLTFCRQLSIFRPITFTAKPHWIKGAAHIEHAVFFATVSITNFLFCFFALWLSSKRLKNSSSMIGHFSFPSIGVNPLRFYRLAAVSNFYVSVKKFALNSSCRITSDLFHYPTKRSLFFDVPLSQLIMINFNFGMIRHGKAISNADAY